MIFRFIILAIVIVISVPATMRIRSKFNLESRSYLFSASIYALIFTFIDAIIFHNGDAICWFMSDIGVPSCQFYMFDFIPYWLAILLDYIIMPALHVFVFVLLCNLFFKKGSDYNREHPVTEEDREKEEKLPGLFRYEDYWPYISGVFVFGGLTAVPFSLMGLCDIEPYYAFVLGLLGSCVLVYSHTHYGRFKIERFLLGVFVVLNASFRAADVAIFGAGYTFFLIVILLAVSGLIFMEICGWIGILIGRATGISNRLKEDPEKQKKLFGIRWP